MKSGEWRAHAAQVHAVMPTSGVCIKKMFFSNLIESFCDSPYIFDSLRRGVDADDDASAKDGNDL